MKISITKPPKNIKKIAKLLAVPLVLFIIVVIVTPLLMNTEQAKQQLIESIAATYGLTLQTSDDIIPKAYPSPTLYLSNLSLSNAANQEIIAIPSMKVTIGWLGLLFDDLPEIEIIGANFKLTPAQLRTLIASGQPAAQKPAAKLYRFRNATLEILADKMNATYLKDGKVIRGIGLNYSASLNGSPAKLDMQFYYQEQLISKYFSYDPSSRKLNGNTSIGELASINLDGSVDEKTQRWEGNMTFDSANVLALTKWLENKPVDETEEATPEQLNLYPLSFTSKTEITAGHIVISRSEAKFKDTTADFTAFIGWANHLNIGLELNPKSLQVDQFIHDFAEGLLPTTSQLGSRLPTVKTPLPDYLRISYLMTLPQVKIGTKEYSNLNIAAELEGGDVLIHQGFMEMPGESSIRLDGALKQLPEGRRFYGTTKVSGKHFNEWLANFEPFAQKLPAEDFSDFNFEGNVFISKEQLRLSEAQLKIGKLDFQGGFAAFFDQIPRVEAEIRLTDINLDYFRDVWRRQNTDQSPASIVSNNENFEWLRRLPAVLDFRINIDGFTFLDTQGTIASTRLYAQPGHLSLSGLDLRMKDNVIGANVKLDVRKARPNLDIVMSASRFNTDYFSDDKGEAPMSAPLFDPKNKEQIWSNEIIDLSILDGSNGKLDLTIGSLTHGDGLFQNFKWLSELNQRKLTIRSLSFSAQDSSVVMNGSLFGGKVPGFQGSFSLYNADIKKILSDLLDIETISGRVSMSGVVGMSGIHPQAWLQNSDIKLTATARGVGVRNLNLQRVIDLTRAARSTQDIRDGVRSSLFDGVTEFSVDGNINIRGGTVRTPGISMRYGRVLGNLKGEMTLLDWGMNLSSFWQFPELSSSTTPTMSISVQGDIDDYATRFDTSSLEAFVAKRIVGQ